MSKSSVFTKYFGNITIDVDDDGHGDIYTNYNNQEINIFFQRYNTYEDKVKICLEIIDKYVEINEIAKKAIMEQFNENATVKNYFKCHFDMWGKEQLIKTFGTDNFKKINIGNIVEKLEYPDLIFSMRNSEITVSLIYMISKNFSDEILCIKMDEKLNITEFLHES